MTLLSVWIDESEKGRCLAVGGILVDWDAVPVLVKGWRSMKTNLGLPEDTEIKWNLPSNHPTRVKLERLGHSTRTASEKAVQFLADSRVSLIVVVMFDERQEWWRHFFRSKASVRDFYCEGLKYVLQRHAEEAAEIGASNGVVICDTPELGNKTFQHGSIRRGRKAVEETYAEWYVRGVGVGPGKKQHSDPLKDAGFHPSILLADATHHDMLQMADIAVGATRAWVTGVADGRPDAWVTQQMKTLIPAFRAKHGKPAFWGDGLVLWPWQKQLWDTLKESLKG